MKKKVLLLTGAAMVGLAFSTVPSFSFVGHAHAQESSMGAIPLPGPVFGGGEVKPQDKKDLVVAPPQGADPLGILDGGATATGFEDDPFAWGADDGTKAESSDEVAKDEGVAVPPKTEVAITPETAPPVVKGDSSGEGASSVQAPGAVSLPDTAVVSPPLDTQKTDAPKMSNNASDNIPATENTSDGDFADRVAALEKRLVALEKDMVSRAEFDKLKKNTQKASSSKASPKSAAKASASQKTTRRATAPAVSWVLKSAKPGMAWVSEKGNSELRMVSVGDTLPGIGTVSAVEKNDSGRWIVRGSAGVLRQ
ncbi:MAG: hypothetical protein OXT65_02160 [Alphaproteobacteria bacterium]|nr:hypothetical protein [Alphaproteobacteria bacterium]